MRRHGPILLLGLGLAVGLGLAALPGVRAGLWHVGGLLAEGDLPGVRDYLRSFGAWAPVVSLLLIQVQAVIAPLPSFPLMYANGLLFGAWWGGLLSWLGILLSALLCFGLARAGGRPLVERLASPRALARADPWLARVGPSGVFLLRLMPLTAFDLVSFAAGLTPMRLGPFALATGLGMAPAIFLTAAAGALGVRSPAAFAVGLGGVALLGAVGLLIRRRPRGAPGPAAAAVSSGRGTARAAGGGTAASGAPGTSRPAG